MVMLLIIIGQLKLLTNTRRVFSQGKMYYNTTILCALFSFTFSLVAQNAQEVAKKAFASTVLLVMEDENGQPSSLGSGFFIGDDLIATNLHVIEGSSRGYAKLIGKKTKFDIQGYTAIDADRDLAILKISTPFSSTLSLGDSDTCEVGENVFAVGNPKGLEGTFSQGIVSSIRDAGSDKLLQITAPISPGSSGGPVLNARGDVIGVSVATYRGGQNLNFAIPVNYLKELLFISGSTKPLQGSKKTKINKSILSDLGGRSVEGVVGVQFMYDNGFAQTGYYTFSLRNKLRDTVTNVQGLIVFYDSSGLPIEVDTFGGSYSRITIPGGLAKRLRGNVDGSVQKLTTRRGNSNPITKIEIRILNFDIVE